MESDINKDIALEEYLQNNLERGEVIQWTGKPVLNIWLRFKWVIIAVLVLEAIIYILKPSMFTSTISTINGVMYFVQNILLYIVVLTILYLVVTLPKLQALKNICYALTNRRLLIMDVVKHQELLAKDLATIGSPVKINLMNGIGDLIFGCDYPVSRQIANFVFFSDKSLSPKFYGGTESEREIEPFLYNIPDVDNVYGIVTNTINQLPVSSTTDSSDN